jgi:hypothetical protein
VEGSERVKAAAAEALNRCTVVATLPEVEKKKNGDVIKKTELNPQEYFKRIREISQAEILDEAQQALADFRAKQPAAEEPAQRPGPTRPTSVAAILSNAFSPSARNSGAAPVETAAEPSADPAAESKVLNAVLTSQAKTAAAAPQAPPTAAAVDRKPFFDNLTRALKGKQTGRTIVVPTEQSTPASAAPTATTSQGETQPGVAAPAANPEAEPLLTPGAGTAPSTPLTAPVLPRVPETPALPPLP